MALERAPEIASKVGRCVLMGGAPCCEGNVTPAAEYNVWADPEAAKIVMRSGMPVELVGWHLCRGDAALRPSDIDRVLALNTPLARFAIEFLGAFTLGILVMALALFAYAPLRAWLEAQLGWAG